MSGFLVVVAFLVLGFCSVPGSVGLRFGRVCPPLFFLLPPPPLSCLLVLCVLHLSLAPRMQLLGESSPAMALAPSGPPPRVCVWTCLLLGDDGRTRGEVGRRGDQGHCDPTQYYGRLSSNHGGTPPLTKPSRFANAGFRRVCCFHIHLGLRVGAT